MDRTTPLLTLALLALCAPAMASDPVDLSIDDLATSALSASESVLEADGAKVQHRSRTGARTSGNKRPAATPARGPAQRPTAAPVQRTASRPPAANRPASGTYARGPSPRPMASAAPYGPPPSPRPMASAAPGRPGAPAASRPPTGPSRPGAYGAPGHASSRPPTVVHGRPGGTVVHGRPGTVVHGRPGTVVHGRPGVVVHRPGVVVHRAVVVHRPVVHYAHVRPYHGVFVYGPRPVTHVQYVEAGPGPVAVERNDLPERQIDRNDALSLGVRGGSFVSGTTEGQVYGDPGLGLVGRYRPAETIGLELALGHYGSGYVDPIGSRAQTQVSSSVELFAWPWTRVSPYALGGVTWNSANLSSEIPNGDAYDLLTETDSQWGLHGGLGIEFALGNHFALDLEGRYIGWLDERAPNEAPGALQGSVGLNYYFK